MWQRFSCFCFDFDGLLVDTEPLHYEAFSKATAMWGLAWDWDFDTYLRHAHSQSSGALRALEKEFPQIVGEEGMLLVKRKQAIYEELLQEKPPRLMPGVHAFLDRLEQEGRLRCVVTNSVRSHVELVKKAYPILQSIPLWITREEYLRPKPAPDGYQKALAQLGCVPNSAIGFEDSVKGVQALVHAGIHAVWICPKRQMQASEYPHPHVQHVESFASIF